MRTNQPSYFCVENQGDVDPLNHGGVFVLVDRRGIYDPQLWVWEPDSSRMVSFDMPRCFPIKGDPDSIGSNRYHPDLPEWFGTVKELESVASTCGKTPHVLRSQLCAPDPCERARGYYDLFCCYGAMNFDTQPWSPTWKEARKTIGRLIRQITAAAKWEDAA